MEADALAGDTPPPQVLYLVLLTLLLPEPVGPTSMRPCRTTVVSYSWMHLIRKPRRQGRGHGLEDGIESCL